MVGCEDVGWLARRPGTRRTPLVVSEHATTQRPRLLCASEAAEFLRLRESTLYDYARRGIVPSVKFGRHLRFIESDLTAWIQGLRQS